MEVPIIFTMEKSGYHPIFMFEGDTRYCLNTALRHVIVNTLTQIVAFVGPEQNDFEKYPNIKFIIRGKSGFATPKLYDFANH